MDHELQLVKYIIYLFGDGTQWLVVVLSIKQEVRIINQGILYTVDVSGIEKFHIAYMYVYCHSCTGAGSLCLTVGSLTFHIMSWAGMW